MSYEFYKMPFRGVSEKRLEVLMMLFITWIWLSMDMKPEEDTMKVSNS
jgi:hypothetical protein